VIGCIKASVGVWVGHSCVGCRFALVRIARTFSERDVDHDSVLVRELAFSVTSSCWHSCIFLPMCSLVTTFTLLDSWWYGAGPVEVVRPSSSQRVVLGHFKKRAYHRFGCSAPWARSPHALAQRASGSAMAGRGVSPAGQHACACRLPGRGHSMPLVSPCSVWPGHAEARLRLPLCSTPRRGCGYRCAAVVALVPPLIRLLRRALVCVAVSVPSR
jgi:hypothetical protein